MIELKSFIINEENAVKYAGAIAAWIKEKTKTGVVLGMSGGIDCCVAARLCQLAGVDIHLVMLPCGDDMKNTRSCDHAMKLIEKFNFSYHIFDIKPAVEALSLPIDLLDCDSGELNMELSLVNIRPRVRMAYLYRFAQLNNRLVIGTDNLSERTIGYFTKWGDGACDFNPLAMLTKQEVYTLARYLEVPDCIINKKPSAGLWDGQTDESELGMTYAQIDAYIINGTSGNPETDRKIEERIAKSAHKRAPIPFFEG